MPAAALLALAALAAAPPSPVVAEVAGEPLRLDALEARLGGAREPEAVAAALAALVDERLLASEAAALLGPAVAGVPAPEAAARLLRHLFDPGRACAELPEALRRTRYDETRWRFVAPPAWTVEDLQLLCCRDPRRCGDPEVQACVDATAEEARGLLAALPADAGTAGLQAAFEALAPAHPRLAIHRYTFYFDPARPDGPVDGRLQEVDRPIAETASALAPGGVAGPVRTRFGHHVLRLVARRDGVDLPWEDPRTQALLRTELCAPFLVRQRARYAEDLRRGASVRVRREAVAAAFGEAAVRALTAR